MLNYREGAPRDKNFDRRFLRFFGNTILPEREKIRRVMLLKSSMTKEERTAFDQRHCRRLSALYRRTLAETAAEEEQRGVGWKKYEEGYVNAEKKLLEYLKHLENPDSSKTNREVYLEIKDFLGTLPLMMRGELEARYKVGLDLLRRNTPHASNDTSGTMKDE